MLHSSEDGAPAPLTPRAKAEKISGGETTPRLDSQSIRLIPTYYRVSSINEMKDMIQEGDIVQVDFNNAQTTLCRNAVVIYKPTAPGEGWVFEDSEAGITYHVSEGCTISRRSKIEVDKTKESKKWMT